MSANMETFRQRLAESQGDLYALILALTGAVEEAWDVLQETNLALLRRANEYDVSLQLMPLFRQFARVQVERYWQKTRRSHLIYDDELAKKIAESCEAEVEKDENVLSLAGLRNCLDKLPSNERRLVEDRWFRGVSVKNKAKALGVTENSLCVFLFRIRRRLKDCIESFKKERENVELTGDANEDFQMLLARSLEGVASYAERASMFRILAANHSFIPLYVEQMHFAALLNIERRQRSVKHSVLRMAASFALLFGTITLLAGTFFFKEKAKVSALTNNKEDTMNLQTLVSVPIVAAAVLPAWEAHPLDWSSRCSEASSATFVDSRVAHSADATSYVATRVFCEATATREVNSSMPTGTIVILM